MSSAVDSDYDYNESFEDGIRNVGRDGTHWCSQPPRPPAYRQRNIVTVPSGPTMPTRGFNDADQIFKYLLDETIVREIVEFTNTRLEYEHIDADFSVDESYDVRMLEF